MSNEPIEIVNARILKTFIGLEAHGMMIWSIELDTAAAVRTFGQVQLTEFTSRDQPERVLAWSVSAMLDVLRVLDTNWERLPGKTCRIQYRTSDRKVVAIGNIIEDWWVFPEDYFFQKRGA